MGSNQEFYIKYLNNVVSVETHFIGENERNRPLKTISHLIQACITVPAIKGQLGIPHDDYGPFIISLPYNYQRESLDKECFASDEGMVVDVGCELSQLGNIGLNSKEPLIIKRNVTSNPLTVPTHMELGNRDISIDHNTLFFQENDQWEKTIRPKINMMADSDQLDDIMRRILEMPVSSPYYLFCVFVASSGCGKSFTAISLCKKLKNQQKFGFYFHYTKGLDQLMYQPFVPLSKVFIECYDRDYMEMQSQRYGNNKLTLEQLYGKDEYFGGDSEDPLEVESLSNQSLYVFGFLCLLLTEFKTDYTNVTVNNFSEGRADIKITRKTAKDVKGVCDQEGFTIFLDEVLVKNAAVKFRFVRNALRAAGARVVLIGTNLSIRNAFDNRAGSRGGDSLSIEQEKRLYQSMVFQIKSNYLSPWCIIEPEFPETCLGDVTVTQGYEDLRPYLEDIMKKSRPWFACLFAKHLSNVPNSKEVTCDKSRKKQKLGSEVLLDNILPLIFEDMVKYKSIFENARLGQLALFKPIYYENVTSHNGEPIETGDELYDLVDRHYMKVKKQASINSRQKFQLRFPAIEKDLLLYLCLMGCKDCYPWKDEEGKALSYWAFERLNPCKKTVNANPLEMKLDYLDMEAAMIAIMIVASRLHGTGGSTIQQFVRGIGFCLVGSNNKNAKPTEFQLQGQELLEASNLKALGLDQMVVDTKVPFLSPSNQPWPDCVRKFGNFGNSYSTTDSDIVDLIVTTLESGEAFIVGEAKYWKNTISHAKYLESIHTKIKMSKATIFFIFAQNIADLKFDKDYVYLILEPVDKKYRIRSLNVETRISSRNTKTKKKSKLVIFVCSSPSNEEVAGE